MNIISDRHGITPRTSVSLGTEKRSWQPGATIHEARFVSGPSEGGQRKPAGLFEGSEPVQGSESSSHTSRPHLQSDAKRE